MYVQKSQAHLGALGLPIVGHDTSRMTGPFKSCPKDSIVAHRFNGSNTDPNRPGTVTWYQCYPPIYGQAPAPAQKPANQNVTVNTQVNPNIQTAITPTVSPNFTQVQDSPGAQTGSATSAQNPTGGGITAADLAQILAEQRRADDAARRAEKAERDAAIRAANDRATQAAQQQAEDRARQQAAQEQAQREAQESAARAAADDAAQREANRQAQIAEARRVDAENQRRQQEYNAALAEWEKAAAAAQQSGGSVPPQPQAPAQIAPQSAPSVVSQAPKNNMPLIVAIVVAGAGLVYVASQPKKRVSK